MKKIINIIAGLTLLISSCSENIDVDPKGRMSNYVQMSMMGSNQIAADSGDTLKMNMLFAYTIEKETTITLDVKNNNGLLDIPTELTILPGTKNYVVNIIPAVVDKIDVSQNVSISLGSSSDETIKMYGDKGVVVRVNPAQGGVKVTAEQAKLIEGYMEAYGINLYEVLGSRKVHTKVVLNEADANKWFGGKENLSFEGETVISLSDRSTKDKPILKMENNPMGLTSWFYDIYRFSTVDDEEYFRSTDFGKGVYEASEYNYDNDKFSVSLDGIKLNLKKKIKEIVPLSYVEMVKNDAHNDGLLTIPFKFKFTAWDRVLRKIKEGHKVTVIENDKKVEYNLEDLVYSTSDDGDLKMYSEQGCMDPEFWILNSDLGYDAWENSPSLWVKPTASIDFEKKMMTFVFPLDFYRSEYGYQRIEVIYDLGVKK